MPIAVFLEDIHGTNRRGTVADGYGGLNRCLPIGDESFPLLRYVDPYGNVVFNHLQMQQLLEEINSLISGCSDQESKDLLENVRELAEKCRSSNHLYLRFRGD
jgi:hypothetical protein